MRTWTYLSRLIDAWEEVNGEIDHRKPTELFRKTVQNAVGEGKALSSLHTLTATAGCPTSTQSFPTQKGEVPTEMSVMWAVIAGLISHFDADHELAGRILRYSLKLSPEFAIVLARQCQKIDSEL